MASVTLSDTYPLIQAIIEGMGRSRVVSNSHLCVGVVSSLASSTSYSCFRVSGCIASTVLTSFLGASGDLRKLAPMGRPQVRLGAAAMEEQEVHAGWTALTNCCRERKYYHGTLRQRKARYAKANTYKLSTCHLQFPLQGKRLISCSLVSDLLMEFSLGCLSVPCCHTRTWSC